MTAAATSLVGRIPWLRLVAAVAGGLALTALSTCSPRVSLIDQVRALGLLRVATINSPTTYYEGPAGPTGFEYELASHFASQLGVKVEMIVAGNATEALAMVESGRAHLAAAGVAITPLRGERLRFTRPLLSVVPELVYRMGDRRPESAAELGEGLVVARGSAAAEHLAGLSQTIPGLQWTEVDEADTEELLLKVANGEVRYTVAASDLVAINQRYYPSLRVAFALTEAQDVAWAFGQGPDTSLYNHAQHFLSGMSEPDLARLRDRYFGHVEQVDYLGAVALATHVETRLPKYRAQFEKAAAAFGLDWRLLAAIGYQESHWDPAAVSPTGVRGIMQLTLQTAQFLNVANREDPAQSIWGGARYIRQLMDKVNPQVQNPDRIWFALAAYNMGYGHLLDAQMLTAMRGADPHRWVDLRPSLRLLTQPRWHQKTKYGYARGHEAETYVGNVRTYYDMLVHITGEPPTPPAPATVDLPVQPEKQDPLNIRAPVL
jgi:membrane-bound lytic murein transglycosylase F